MAGNCIEQIVQVFMDRLERFIRADRRDPPHNGGPRRAKRMKVSRRQKRFAKLKRGLWIVQPKSSTYLSNQEIIRLSLTKLTLQKFANI
jgi:hypothetical protein